MSRSNPETNLQNPAVRYFDWKGDTGSLVYYDREKKENVEVKTPFKFLVLDNVVQVAGGVKRYGNYVGYFSNSIRQREISTGWLIVRSKVNGQTNVEGEGTWSHIKGTLQGAKYVTGLYIAFYDDENTLQIGYLKLKGASNTAWIQYNQNIQRKNIFAGAYAIKGKSEPKQNGNTTYFEPVFSWSDKVTPETEEAAVGLDKELQTYLTTYFSQSSQPSEEDHERAAMTEEYTGNTMAAAAGVDLGYLNNEPPMPDFDDTQEPAF